MNHGTSLEAALYIVATPIGNLGDMTFRAVETLRSVDHICAEDTRVSSGLLRHYEIAVDKLTSLHGHNEIRRVELVISWLKEGKSVGLISDAGTPLISDPGVRLVHAVEQAGFPVVPIPGPSSVSAALSVCGLDVSRFFFAGFLPRGEKRKQALSSVVGTGAATVFFEAPTRLVEFLEDARLVLGGSHPVAVCRELTKKFEEVIRGTVDDVIQHFNENAPRGEIVVVTGPFVRKEDLNPEAEIKRLLKQGLGPKEIAQRLMVKTSLPRRELYQLALALRDSGSRAD